MEIGKSSTTEDCRTKNRKQKTINYPSANSQLNTSGHVRRKHELGFMLQGV